MPFSCWLTVFLFALGGVEEGNATMCSFAFAHFMDQYGMPTEFLSFGGKVILPCTCPKSFCNSPEKIEVVIENRATRGQAVQQRFEPLDAKL